VVVVTTSRWREAKAGSLVLRCKGKCEGTMVAVASRDNGADGDRVSTGPHVGSDLTAAATSGGGEMLAAAAVPVVVAGGVGSKRDKAGDERDAACAWWGSVARAKVKRGRGTPGLAAGAEISPAEISPPRAQTAAHASGRARPVGRNHKSVGVSASTRVAAVAVARFGVPAAAAAAAAVVVIGVGAGAGEISARAVASVSTVAVGVGAVAGAHHAERLLARVEMGQ
jgi:hypothetical protein